MEGRLTTQADSYARVMKSQSASVNSVQFIADNKLN